MHFIPLIWQQLNMSASCVNAQPGDFSTCHDSNLSGLDQVTPLYHLRWHKSELQAVRLTDWHTYGTSSCVTLFWEGFCFYILVPTMVQKHHRDSTLRAAEAVASSCWHDSFLWMHEKPAVANSSRIHMGISKERQLNAFTQWNRNAIHYL